MRKRLIHKWQEFIFIMIVLLCMILFFNGCGTLFTQILKDDTIIKSGLIW